MAELWPWLTLVGLGVFHGLNPAMGWLFAVALGQHRDSRRVVLLALLPIAIGHAIAIALVVAAAGVLGVVIDQRIFRISAAVLLIGWGISHAFYGHRHRVRVGMRTGMVGLAIWSFVMATAHGAGLMLLPALVPLQHAGMAGHGGHAMPTGASALVSLAAVGVHTLAMLAVTGLIAVAVYEWLGLGVLRRGWINFDLLWTVMLVAGGILLLVVN